MPTAVVQDLIIGMHDDDDDEDGYDKLGQYLDPTNRQIVRTLLGPSGVREMIQNRKPARRLKF